MKQEDQQDAFYIELENLIDRYRSEFNMTYASFIGVLHMAVWELSNECLNVEDEDSEKEEWNNDGQEED